jgi:PRTRC genetic system ThiF family protein
MQPDPSYANALPILLKPHRAIEFWLIGCGGTGGWLAPLLARLLVALAETGVRASAVFIDPDCVEAANLLRQNFLPCEIGANKAEVLAARYSLACGLKIGAIASSFAAERVQPDWSTIAILIGAVDNAVARREIARTLPESDDPEDLPRLWWLDCGNFGEGATAGQVLLGSTPSFNPNTAFNRPKDPNFVVRLPSPSLQHPQLLQPQPEERDGVSLSCAEIALRNRQALFVNQRAAAEAIEMLSQLVLTKNLRRFATYFHGGAGSSRSLYTAPSTLERYSRSTTLEQS